MDLRGRQLGASEAEANNSLPSKGLREDTPENWTDTRTQPARTISSRTTYRVHETHIGPSEKAPMYPPRSLGGAISPIEPDPIAITEAEPAA